MPSNIADPLFLVTLITSTLSVHFFSHYFQQNIMVVPHGSRFLRSVEILRSTHGRSCSAWELEEEEREEGKTNDIISSLT